MNTTLGSEVTLLTEKKAAKLLWKFVPPFILFIGGVANIFSLWVLVRRKMQRSSTMFYLTLLCFLDLAVLGSTFFSYWLSFGYGIFLFTSSSTSCKIFKFWVYFSTDFCNWILVAVTVDRCVFVCLPFKAEKLCTKKTAKVTILLLGTVMILINLHLLWGIGFSKDSQMKCVEVNNFTQHVWPWIDLSVYCIIPCLTMVVCNACIIRHIVSSRRRIITSDKANEIKRIPTITNMRRKNTVPKWRPVSDMTRMLMFFNLSFLLLTLPIVVFCLYKRYSTRTSEHDHAVMDLARAVVTMFEFTNNAIHFFLFLTGSRFRKEIASMFRRRFSTD